MKKLISKSLVGYMILGSLLSVNLNADSTILKQDIVSKEVFMKNVKLSFPKIHTILKDYEELSKKEKSIDELKTFSTTLEFGILEGIIYNVPSKYNSVKKYLVSKNLDFSYITESSIKKIMFITDKNKHKWD